MIVLSVEHVWAENEPTDVPAQSVLCHSIEENILVPLQRGPGGRGGL